jgi:multicomponent Na+:H+ antiporter subunit C
MKFEFLEFCIKNYSYYLVFFIMFLGFFGAIFKKELIYRLIGLSIFQSSAIILYLLIGFNKNSQYPIIREIESPITLVYNNPLPQVLMLTAIVVGISLFSIGLAIIIKIDK